MQQEDEIPSGYIRVSEVVGMFKSYVGIDPAVLANAADRGQRVHSYCEAYALNEFVGEYDEDCQGYMKSFIPWFDENVESVLMSEKRFNCPFLLLSGKLDMIVKLKGCHQSALIDFKTPVKECATWDLQLAAYYDLAKSSMHIERRQVIQLSKSGKPAKIIEYKNHENSVALFLSALELYKFFNPKNIVLAIKDEIG